MRPLIAIVLVCSVVAQAAPTLPLEALIETGSQRLEAGDLAGALERFEKAARLDSNDPRSRYLAAVAYEKKGDATQAERLFREALKLDPKLADVRAELGALLEEKGRHDDAVTELKQAVALQPDLGDGWFNLGQAELARHRCAEAIPAFQKAASLKPGEAEPVLQRSIALRQCKKNDDAVKAAREAVKIAPQNAMVQLNLGTTLETLGKLDDARTAYTAAAKIKPDYATAFWSLGLLELHANNAAAAKVALEKARSLDPTAARITDLGRAHRDLGDLPRAEALFKEAIAKDPKYTPARFFLAQVFAATGRCAELDKEVTALPASPTKAASVKKLQADCRARRH